MTGTRDAVSQMAVLQVTGRAAASTSSTITVTAGGVSKTASLSVRE